MSTTEKKLLKMVAELFPRSNQQFNKLNESDSELIELKSNKLAINIDEYSFDEDYFSEFNPEILGRNLIMATCSDVIATGSAPNFLLHSMILQKDYPESFTHGLLKGIAEGLKEYQAHLIGGDTSTAEKWRYIAVILGETQKRVKRSGAKQKQLIYTTGKFGAGNRQALVQMLLKQGKLEVNEENILLATPSFPCHLSYLPIISKYATFSMDTSDGMINTLHTLHEVNPNIGFKVTKNLADLIEEESKILATFAHIPPEVFLFSTLGEYQLIFAIAPENEIAFEFDCKSQGLTPIKMGEVCEEQGIHLKNQGKWIRLSDERPDPRSMPTEQYIEHIIHLCQKYFHA